MPRFEDDDDDIQTILDGISEEDINFLPCLLCGAENYDESNGELQELNDGTYNYAPATCDQCDPMGFDTVNTHKYLH